MILPPAQSLSRSLFVATALSAASALANEPATTEQPTIDPAHTEFFETKIRPVLVERCYSCHSTESKDLRGGLRLDSRAALLTGGDSGPSIKPGDAEHSELISAIRYAPDSYQMPPDGQLPPEVIADFEQWVAMGAPDPRSDEPASAPPTASFAEVLAERRKHWAYQPLHVVTPPEVLPARWSHNPIDRFVYAELQAAGLEPAPPADKLTLLRRVYLDLIGLPPPLEAQEKFWADDSPTALETVVDELLARPEYGERWARHWLDVMRYSDTAGHEQDADRPMHWRYRDYVIHALNTDVPYDRFVREHLAGDTLEPPRAGPAGETNMAPNGLTWLWFHEMDHLPPEPNSQRADQVDAQIDVLSKAFLGLTVACARCHDHKFDAISQPDYYALAGVFHSTVQTTQRIAPEAVIADPARAQQCAEKKAEIERLRAEYVVGATNRLKAKWSRPVPVNEDYFGGGEWRNLARLRAELAALDPTANLWCQSAVDEDVRNVPLHIRGLFNKFGVETARGWLTALSPPQQTVTFQMGSGRAELAEQILAADLTRRVIVNRLWQHHFGRGIVASSSNFGVQGEAPTHPELLDYLADRFVAEGWSLKKMHRLMLLSSTYQLSSRPIPESLAADPQNKLFHYLPPRRLDAEVIRDSLLAVSQQLDTTHGGPGVQPYVSPNASASRSEFLPASGPLDGARRRSIYITVRQNYLTSMLVAFDFPHPGTSVGVRDQTCSPVQSLSMLNNPFVQEQAAAWAAQSTSIADDSRRATHMFREAYCREPTGAELIVMQDLLDERRRTGSTDSQAAWNDLAHVLMCAEELQFAF